MLLMSADRRKKKQKEKSKAESAETEESALYGIVSSPSEDSPRLTLKISRVKSGEADRPRELSHQSRAHSHQEDKSVKDHNQLPRTDQDLSQDTVLEEQLNCQQVPVWQSTKDTSSFDDVEMDPLAEMERIERETASERERWSKEVQDKGSIWPQARGFIFNLNCIG